MHTRTLDQDAPSGRVRMVAVSLLLMAMTAAAYLPALQAGFIWNDDAYVTANHTLRSLDGLRQIWFEPGAVPQYYPLTFSSFWIEYHLWKLQPFGYHLINILLHGLNVLLVWRVLRRLRVPGAWLGAAVFGLHPMQVESVAWITERKNVLSGLFALSAVLVYLRGMASRATNDTRIQWRCYGAVCVLFLAALLSKTATCTLPVVLLLLVWWQRGTLDRRTLWQLAPLFAMGIIMAAVTVRIERAQGEEWALSLIERALVAGRALWSYPATLVWPRSLAFVYPRWSVDAHVWWQYLYPAVVVAVITVFFVGRRQISAGPLLATLCYACMLAPALGFFNIFFMRYSFVADHFGYLPSIALIALATAAGADLIQRLKLPYRYIGWAASSLVLLELATLTTRQCGIYRDQRTLWADTVVKNPESCLAHDNLGMALATQGRTDEAIAHLEQAVRLRPDYAEAQNDLGAALGMQGNTGEALAHLEQAVRLRPTYAEAHSNIGNVLARQGKLAEAIAHYGEALRLQPTNADTHTNIAMALMAQGKTTEAIAHFEEAVRDKPDSTEIRNNLNRALQARGHSRQPATRD